MKDLTRILHDLDQGNINSDEAEKRVLDLFGVSERYLNINDAAALIKSMPTNQAIHKMKATLSGQPETTVIEGELLVSLNNARQHIYMINS